MEILSAPRKLTEYEEQIIRTHPVVAYNILIEIPFFSNIAQIVLQHHERLDGSGYPLGLKGDKILPEAKILAVADTVEAMANHRPYRPALPVEEVISEIYKNRGEKYDKRVVDICIPLIMEGKIQLTSSSL